MFSGLQFSGSCVPSLKIDIALDTSQSSALRQLSGSLTLTLFNINEISTVAPNLSFIAFINLHKDFAFVCTVGGCLGFSFSECYYKCVC